LIHIKPRRTRHRQSCTLFGNPTVRTLSATGVAVLDRSVQETIVWLKRVEEEFEFDNGQQASTARHARASHFA